MYPVITDSGDMCVTILDQDDYNPEDTDAQVYQVKSDHPDYENLLDAVETNDINYFLENVDIAKPVQDYVDGSGIEVLNGEVLYNGQVIHNSVCDDIIAFMQNGLNYQPLVNFLNNLMQNPSFRSIEQLYTFRKRMQMPITEDGCFLAYKSVTGDYKDHHTGTFDNRVGATHKMPRNQVSDDVDLGCSNGFHVGTLEYASTFGGAGSKLVLVKVNPKDVVSVPKDCSYQKCRVCEYTVVANYKNPLDKCCYNY